MTRRRKRTQSEKSAYYGFVISGQSPKAKPQDVYSGKAQTAWEREARTK